MWINKTNSCNVFQNDLQSVLFCFFVPRQDPIVKCKFLLLRHSDVNYHLLAILKSSTRDIFSHCLSLSFRLSSCMSVFLFAFMFVILFISLLYSLLVFVSPSSSLFLSCIIVNYHLSFLLFLFPDIIFFCSYLSLLFSLFVILDPVKLVRLL